MTINVQKVKPGDLITAAFFNEIVDALDSLQAQIDALGTITSPPSAPGAPFIASVEPVPVPAGTTLTIHGHDFAVPAVLNTVNLGGVALGDFPAGSTDQILKVNVPGDLAGVPGTKDLQVSTTAGPSNVVGVQVSAPQIVLGGQVRVTDVTSDQGTITVGNTYTFQFELDASALDEAEQFLIQANYQNAVGATETQWDAATTYIGTGGGNHEVTVTPALPVTVGVQVTVPANAQSVDLTVAAVSVHNDPASSNESPTVPIVIGQAQPQTDPSIQLAFGTNLKTTLHPATFPNFEGEGLAVKYGSNPALTFEATMGHGGNYRITGDIQNPDTTVWQIGTDLPMNLTFADGQGQQIQFNLKLVPTSPPTQDVTRYFTLTATRQDDDEIGQISNFMRFPIGGFVS